jgi:hypothetical protein
MLTEYNKQDMERMIKQSYPRQDGRREIGKGQYSIYHEGQAIPPELWAESVGPGKKFEVKLWKSETIKFKDAIGRKFNFPFHLVQTWKVSQAFSPTLHVCTFLVASCGD